MQQPLQINQGASLDVTWDWSAWLGTDSIASFTVNAPVGFALSSITQAGGKVTAWVSPVGLPALGTVFIATCAITTANSPPRVDSRDMSFIIVRK